MEVSLEKIIYIFKALKLLLSHKIPLTLKLHVF